MLFPAVTATGKTWNTYASVFAKWFEYAGMVVLEGTMMKPTTLAPSVVILDPSGKSRGSKVFPQRAPDPALRFLLELHVASGGRLPSSETTSAKVVDLIALGLVERDGTGYYTLAGPNVIVDGEYSPEKLLFAINAAPGARECIALLEANPRASGFQLGEQLSVSQNVSWSEGTKEVVGKQFRAWANRAGVFTGKGARRTRKLPLRSGDTTGLSSGT